jgi:UDP-GlcNAc:undecaprenyl-phosphate/decaprenyl-phosphate GlcNAc-1-phosphate transferase
MLTIILAFCTAFTLTYFSIPPIIRIAYHNNLLDEPDDRRSHTERIPSLGGVAMYGGILFSIVLWTPFAKFGNLQYILCAFIILFLIGVKDDIEAMDAKKKMVAQIVAVAILVIKSDIRLEGLYGFFSWDSPMPYGGSLLFSMFTILVIINAFNLIDGINGLAASLGALVSGIFGVWFLLIGHLEFATLAFATVGAAIAFLRYNVTPAQIFMGDTGSLTLGIVTAILTVEFIDLNDSLSPLHPLYFEAIPAVAIGIVIFPLFDTLRVFITRMYRGISPFAPDRRHIHHLLIDYGWSHMEATAILVSTNIGFIVLVFGLDPYVEQHVLLGIVLAIAGALTYFLHRAVVRKKSFESERDDQNTEEKVRGPRSVLDGSRPAIDG